MLGSRELRGGIGAAMAVALCVSCSSGGGGGSGFPATGAAPGGAASPAQPGPGGAPGTPAAPAQPPAGQWLRGDLHVHSRHSHDATTYGDNIETTIKLAESAGLDFVVISDHRHVNVLTDPQFTQTPTSLIVVAGEEWGGSGHAGAHNVYRDPPAHSQDRSQGAQNVAAQIDSVIDDIHSQNGFFVLNHPLDPKNAFLWDCRKFDGVEIWNSSWSYRWITDLTESDVRRELQDLGLTAAGVDASPEFWAGTAAKGGGNNYQALKFYEAHLSSGRHISAVGGGDRHFLLLPGMPATYVFATDRSPNGISEAVRRGRTYVTRGPDACQVDFAADRDGDGVFETILGDSIPLSNGRPIDFRIDVRDADGGKVNLIKNGQVVQTWNVTGTSFTATFQDQPQARSWYRLDVYEPIDMSFPNAQFIKYLVMGVPLQNLGFLGSTIQNLASRIQWLVDTGGPLAVYILAFGHQSGITQSPLPTAYPTFVFPEGFSRLVNLDLQDPDYCRGAITSPIWVE
ncbi:MAG: CehA/McbA family metallohydrolase [Actinobacteria bacterium]|nr:CehA/McbA family metallohydrolase [Actinomycetota bacterium]